MEHHDLLVEILTEELPPKRLQLLESTFANSVRQHLIDTELSFSDIKSYATPRRLALYIKELAERQLSQKIEYKGPHVNVAYNSDKTLTPAGLGFLKKCGISADALTTIQTDKGECLYFSGEKQGLTVEELIPHIIKAALKELPVPKPMRWGSHDFTFIRPVHSVILLYGERVIPAEILGKKTGRITQGHRQLSHDHIEIGFPNNYPEELEERGCVVVDRSERKAIILEQISNILTALSEISAIGNVKIAVTDQGEYAELLDEVTALVEWPKALLCRFDKNFLSIPKEALMASMQGHQKCFAICDEHEKLLPYFITISNLQSEDETEVIRGNERVMHARLSDASFFYAMDLKTSLESLTPRLMQTIYQEKLGTLADKAIRIKNIACCLTKDCGQSSLDTAITRAASLCKLDLFSHMVGEFPELQGTMGKYYALYQGETEDIAKAIEEHYWPRFSHDKIPTAPVSAILALADRLDTIIGFYSIGLIPTGDKDPFGLKRAALGCLKIIFENQLPIQLKDAIHHAICFSPNPQSDLLKDISNFFIERLKTIMLDKNITADVFNAIPNPMEEEMSRLVKRAQALLSFKQHSAAPLIIQTDKRIKNILIKNKQDHQDLRFSLDLAEKDIEKTLWEKIAEIKTQVIDATKKTEYSQAALLLSQLESYIDLFFKEVMVMVDNTELRENRVALLKELRDLFLSVGELSELELPRTT